MSKPSKKDLQQQKLVFDLFELLEKDSFQEVPLQEIRGKIRNIKDINKWAINMEALELSERYGPPHFDYAVKYAMDHPEIKGTIGRRGYKGNISLLEFVFQPIRAALHSSPLLLNKEIVMEAILDKQPNIDTRVKSLVDHGARANMDLYNFWVGLDNDDDDDDEYDNPDGLHKYHAIKEHLKKGLGRTAKTLQRTRRRRTKAKKTGDDVRLKLATETNLRTKYMKDNMETSVWNKIKKGLEEDGISKAQITKFKKEAFDPKWERRNESEIEEWFQETLYHSEGKKEIWRKIEQTLTKKGLSKENIKVFENKFKRQWNQFKSKNREILEAEPGLPGGPLEHEMWDEAMKKDINKWFQEELEKKGTMKKKKKKKKKRTKKKK